MAPVTQLRRACFLLFRPIARLMLAAGVNCQTAVEELKRAFVEEAREVTATKGRPTNIARISRETSLTRREVRRILESGLGRNLYEGVSTSILSHLLSAWHNDDRFVDEHGNPASLFREAGSPSLLELAGAYAPQYSADRLCEELIRIGAITVEGSGKLTAAKRILSPKEDLEYAVMALRHSAYALLSTIANNASGKSPRLPQLVAYSTNIAPKDLKRLRRISLDRLEDFAMAFDDLFGTYSSPNDADQATLSSTVAVGCYYFEETDPTRRKLWLE